jgi:hypothetical protein
MHPLAFHVFCANLPCLMVIVLIIANLLCNKAIFYDLGNILTFTHEIHLRLLEKFELKLAELGLSRMGHLVMGPIIVRFIYCGADSVFKLENGMGC